MSRDEEITWQERQQARKLIRELEQLAVEAPWAAWLLRPLARLLRWMITPAEDAA